MRPRAFLEPAFRVPYRPQIPGNGTPRFLLFTTKRTRNGQDLRWIPCPLRIEFDHLFVRSAKTSPTSSLNLFIYYFLEEEEEEAKKTLAPSANHFWHTHTRYRIQFKHTGVSKLEKFVLLVFRDTYIHFLRVERGIINRSKEKSLFRP